MSRLRPPGDALGGDLQIEHARARAAVADRDALGLAAPAARVRERRVVDAHRLAAERRQLDPGDAGSGGDVRAAVGGDADAVDVDRVLPRVHGRRHAAPPASAPDDRPFSPKVPLTSRCSRWARAGRAPAGAAPAPGRCRGRRSRSRRPSPSPGVARRAPDGLRDLVGEQVTTRRATQATPAETIGAEKLVPERRS